MKKSIIVPVYNEQGNIGDLISKINLVLSEQDELIVVNDGSSDNTETEIEYLQTGGILQYVFKNLVNS